MRRRLAAFAFALLATSAQLAAQDLRGTVVQADDVTPAAGAVILLLHNTKDSTYARIVTGERGTFVLRAPASTPFRLRVLRLGYQPTNVGTYTLAVGQTENVRVKLSEQRVVLASFDIAATKRCDVRPDNAKIVAQLYEEARKALLASATPTSAERNQTQFVLYTRAEDPRGRLAAPVERTAFNGPSNRPFASLPADSLAKVGYVVEQEDGTVYRAPDADVLLADSFLESHCLRLIDGTGDRSMLVGIGFEPVVQGTKLVDVSGTLWLDRESNELQYLEYEYVGIPTTHARAGAGGRVDYTQMASGLWFVNKWAIRMPRFAARNIPRLSGMRGSTVGTAELAGLQVIGGEVQWLKINEETVYSNIGAMQAGSDPKDILDLKVTGGGFEVAGNVQQVDPAKPITGADTLFASSSCVAVATDGYTGQVNGRVRDADQRKFESVPVIAEWKEDFRVAGKHDIMWQVRRLETRTSANGDYVFCGLPLARPITLSATNNGRKSRALLVRLTPKEPRTTMNLAVGENIGSTFSAADARYKGAVMFVVDQNGNPVAHATVNVSGGMSRVADSDGRVMLSLAPRDSLPVIVRRLGYTAFDGKAGRDSATGPFRVVLRSNAQQLNTVTVNDRRTKSPLELTGFYERAQEVHRGAYSGEFFTPEDLNARPAMHITQFLQGGRWTSMSKGNSTTVITGRSQCAMAIVVDGIQMTGVVERNHNRAVEMSELSSGKLDVNALVSMSQVAAIEVYPSTALAPTSISAAVKNGNCGIVAIWTGSRLVK